MPLDYQPIFTLSRGGHPESLQFGAIALVDVSGNFLASLGNPKKFFFPRSCAKPFQAMPLIEAGGLEEFKLSEKDIALICSSHSGTDEHFQVLVALQEKIGIEEESLLCGVHPPYHQQTARRMLEKGEELTSARHNCSGKHSGMLALAILKGWDLDDYVNPHHPVQIAVKESFSSWTGVAAEEMALGIDGCSAPNFAVPLHNCALAFARLMKADGMNRQQSKAALHVSVAMRAHPEMVAGPDRFDMALMKATKGRLLSKEGAEGFRCVGIPENALGKDSQAIGLAIKIADGDARGWASNAVTIEVLKQIGALTLNELSKLERFGPHREIQNQAGIVVGEAQADFFLEQH